MKSKLEKNKEAEERAKARSKRSHKDQLALLDAKFGSNQGAAKERARLKGLIESAIEKVEKKKKSKKQQVEDQG